jgi:hypothetical protein
MASAPPWNTTENDDASRFTTTSMATAAYTPVKSLARPPWGVEESRPSTSLARSLASRRAPAGSAASSAAPNGPSFARWGAASAHQQAHRAHEQREQCHPHQNNQQHPQRQQDKPDARLAIVGPSTLEASHIVAVSRSGSGWKRAVAQQQQHDAHSIHVSTAGDGPLQRPKRYFSNYVDAAKGHTYKVSEVDRHVLTNRNLEGSPTAPAPLVFRQFARDTGGGHRCVMHGRVQVLVNTHRRRFRID